MAATRGLNHCGLDHINIFTCYGLSKTNNGHGCVGCFGAAASAVSSQIFSGRSCLSSCLSFPSSLFLHVLSPVTSISCWSCLFPYCCPCP
jgi:hypothetical protein